MGTVALGLSQIGTALQQAKDQRLKDQLAQIKLAIDQGNLTVSQQYPKLRQQELEIERQREARLARTANQPGYLGHVAAPDGSILYATQDPRTGEVKWQRVPYNSDVTGIMQELSDGINQLPKEVQPVARAAVGGYLQMGRFKEAKQELNKYLFQAGKDLSSTETISEGTQAVAVDVPGYGPVIVQVPTRRVTRKVPSGQAAGVGIAPVTGGDTEIPVPLKSGATDYPNVPQMGVPAAGNEGKGASKVPPIPLPPGSRIIGVKPAAGAGGKLKPEMQAGLRVLHVSLWGTPSSPGLDTTVGVLDSIKSRTKMIAAGVGTTPDPKQWTVTRLAHAGWYSMMSPEEKAYVYQLNRAVSAINALRTITGLPRSTQALMDRYILELPNPVTTPSSKDARNQMQLIEREIGAALDEAMKMGPVTAPQPGVPDTEDLLPGEQIEQPMR